MTEQMSAKEYRDAFARERKPSKYRNVRTTVDGITFDSKREAERYGELKTMEAAGVISDLELQPRFPLTVNDERVGTYVGDFMYHDNEDMRYVVEDAKGVRTDVYKLKRKLVKAIYDITIQEV